MTHHDQPRRIAWRHGMLYCLLPWCGLLVALVGGCWLVSGRQLAEKVMTSLALPCGLVWLGLFAVAWVAWVQRRTALAICASMVWIIYWAGAADIVPDQAVRWLEQPYAAQRPLEGPAFETLVLLGGGAQNAVNGSAAAGLGGDRILLAARMFHAGLAKQIICTGQQLKGAEQSGLRDDGVLAKEILISLAVPADSIQVIGGRNTSEEMQHLARQFENHPPQRVGLITSAWHMKRAMRLANRAELDVQPVPADFWTSTQPFSVLIFLPSAHGLRRSQTVAKEWLAGLVGR